MYFEHWKDISEQENQHSIDPTSTTKKNKIIYKSYHQQNASTIHATATVVQLDGQEPTHDGAIPPNANIQSQVVKNCNQPNALPSAVMLDDLSVHAPSIGQRLPDHIQGDKEKAFVPTLNGQLLTHPSSTELTPSGNDSEAPLNINIRP